MLVTGGSAGIGRVIAGAFGRESARVSVTYRSNAAGADDAVEEVRAAGGEAIAVPLELGDAASIGAAVAATEDAWGGLHVLVHSAVRWQNGDGDWRDVLRENLEGTFAAVAAAAPAMERVGWGRIVLISSNLAEEGMPGQAAYTAAKAGLHGLAKTLAKELAPRGILTNVVVPGLTLDERTRRAVPEPVLEAEARQTPTGRLTLPQEVASVVVFLASEANGHVNGELVRVTGGY